MKKESELLKIKLDPKYHFKVYNLDAKEVLECYSITQVANFIISKFRKPAPPLKQKKFIVKYDSNNNEIAFFRNLTEMAEIENFEYAKAHSLVKYGLQINGLSYKKELKNL